MLKRRLSLGFPVLFLGFTASAAVAAASCAATTVSQFTGGGGASTTSGQGTAGTGTGGRGGSDILDFDASSDAPLCSVTCSSDFHTVLDCNGGVIQNCTGLEGCDVSTGSCKNACEAATTNKQSVGCEYYATFMDQFTQGSCFAVFVANTWSTPAHVSVEYGGQQLPVASFTRIPQGSGQSLTYQPFDAAAGIPPNEVAVLFLSGPQGQPSPGNAPCPINSAIPSGVMLSGTSGIGQSFRIVTDVPVVSYEINPYGGGSAAVTGASLLLPTSVWDTNYVAVNASPYDIANPSMNIVAMADQTLVTLLPNNPVQGGGGIPSGPANAPLQILLQRGQHAQISQQAALTGSVIQSDKPVGLMAGQQCMRVPQGVAYCDHGEQMIPPIKALGNEYVGVMYRPRVGEPAIWKALGVVDGTVLTYSSDVGGPAALNLGQEGQFITGTPFTVKSQDKDHPFLLFTYMSGSTWQPGLDGYGDADFVLSVPPEQYMSHYVFFTDPTYPETNLVIVRAKSADGFKDVTLDCAGVIGGWQPVGDYEWARIDLITGNFQGVNGCSTGRHEINSDGRFGLWVWGWGTPNTSAFTANVSYGYPGGMNVQPINTLVVPTTPK